MEAQCLECKKCRQELPVQRSISPSLMMEQNGKDCLQEKVIPDEAWSITLLPEGYECVDAMFMVEAEGTCMLQQEIPVVPDDNLQPADQSACLEEDESQTEQEVLPSWPFPLCPGALEAEEEKEMMEQKRVLEPCMTDSGLMVVSLRPLKDCSVHPEVKLDPVIPDEHPEVNKELEIINEGNGNDVATKKQVHEEVVVSELCPGSSSLHLEQLRIVDAQVACH